MPVLSSLEMEIPPLWSPVSFLQFPTFCEYFRSTRQYLIHLWRLDISYNPHQTLFIWNLKKQSGFDPNLKHLVHLATLRVVIQWNSQWMTTHTHTHIHIYKYIYIYIYIYRERERERERERKRDFSPAYQNT